MPYSDPEKQKEAQHNWYIQNKEKYRSASIAQHRKKRAYVAEYKNKPCMDCGTNYPWYVMDLDHREGVKKINNLARMIGRSGWSIIIEELKKCDVVCANCHRIRTHTRKMAL